jgi:hypothetical protein
MEFRIKRKDVFMEAIFETVNGKTELLVEVDIGYCGLSTVASFPRILTDQEMLEICEELRTVPMDELHDYSRRLGFVRPGDEQC